MRLATYKIKRVPFVAKEKAFALKKFVMPVGSFDGKQSEGYHSVVIVSVHG